MITKNFILSENMEEERKMKLEEILKAKGIEKETVQSILSEMKQNKIFLTNEENMDTLHKDLKLKYENKDKEHQSATSLIEELKKGNVESESLQSKIAEYETKVNDLQSQNQQLKIDSELKIALLNAKVEDIDYLTFKIREKGEIQLSEEGKIKNIDDTITLLKTQYPNQFLQETQKKIQENKLQLGDLSGSENAPNTLAEALSAVYQSKAE